MYKFSIILISIFILIYCYATVIQIHLIYSQFPLYTNHKVIKNVLTPQETKIILNESINYAKLHKWQLKRHYDYPTTDNEITQNWKSYKILKNKCDNIIFKNIEQLFYLVSNKLTIDEFFVCKYNGNDNNKQNNLEFHVDNYEFSFVIALNDDFKGGGTIFKSSNEIIKLKTGDCLIFCGQTKHGGNKVTMGTRYIVSGFLKYGEFDYDKYYNND